MKQLKNFIFPIRRGWVVGCTLVVILTGCKIVQRSFPAPPAGPQDVPTAMITLAAETPVPVVPTPTPARIATPGATAPAQEPDPLTENLPPEGDPSLALRPEARQAVGGLEAAPHYRIALQISPDGSSFHGHQSVLVTNQEDRALDQLFFRLLPNGGKSYGSGSLLVDEVKAGGQAVQAALSLENTVLEIRLPQPLAMGEATALDFSFEGRVPHSSGSEQEVGYGIYNLTGRVLSLSGWYPILAVYDAAGWNLDPVSAIGDSVYSDMAFYTVQVCLAQGWMVAATGTASDRTVSGEQACTQFESGPARDFFLAASPDFKLAEETVDGVSVHSIYLTQDEAAGGKALAVAVDALKIYNRRFGAYPYNELDVVEMPLRYALGVEYPGIVLIGAELYREPDGAEISMTTAHEVAHQWWYNIVGNDVFDNPWLDEGLTTYSSTLYYEDTAGPPAARRVLDSWAGRWQELRRAGQDDLITQSLAHFESLPEPDQVYSGVVYLKAALFLDALRKEIGDQAFFAGLQQYYQTYQYKIATDEDLQNVFEQTAGRSLDDFYQKWLYSKDNS